MRGNNQIIIEACANGFVVIFPEVMTAMYQPGGDFFQSMVAAGKAIKEDSDDIMSKIKNQQTTEDEKQSAVISKADNVFIFATFGEVLSFLKYKMIE